jgi:uncharacterized membrane protein YgcG
MNQGMRIATAAWLCAVAGWTADWRTLQRQGYLSDFAGVVDSLGRREIDAYCAALEKATGASLSLVIVGSLQKEPVHDVAQTIFQFWSPGQTTSAEHVLLLISLGDRRDALIAGQALRQIIDPSAIDAILSQTRPALSRNEYENALMAAADEIGSRIAAAKHKTIDVHLPRRARRTLSDSIPWPLIAGAIPLIGLLIWLLRRPDHRPTEESV